MMHTSDRQHFRDLVAQVATRAKAILPEAINGRLEGAVKLVLMGDVEPQEDGSIMVGSCSDPLRTYHLEGHTCTCKDFVDGKAPQGWCRHRIAAGIAKRTHEILAAQATPPEPQPQPAALPEAPVSITLKAHLHGHEVLVTLRGHDFASVKTQVEEASAWLKAHAPAAPAADLQQPATQAPEEQRFCPTHGAMKPSTKGSGWYCPHKTVDGNWCPSKAK